MLIDIGYKNYVRAEEVEEILDTSSRKAGRLRRNAKTYGLLVNAASGLSAKSMLILRSGHVILSVLNYVDLLGVLGTALSQKTKHNESVLPSGARIIDSEYDKAPERARPAQMQLPFFEQG